MNQETLNLKFANVNDKKMFAIEESLVDYDQLDSISESDLTTICEDMMTLKERRDQRRRRKGRIRDHKRSRLMKMLWKSKRKDFMKGIRKFSKSMSGKRMHQKVGRNRKMGKYRPISEWYSSVSSLLTHLAIQTGYTSTINEEVEFEMILEAANDILLPVLSTLKDNLHRDDFDVNEMLNACEAGQLIDDLMGISEDLGDDDDEGDDEEEDEDDLDDDDDRSGDSDKKGKSDDDASEAGGGSLSDMNPVARQAAIDAGCDGADPVEKELLDLDKKITDDRVSENSVDESNVLDPSDVLQTINESYGSIDYDTYELITESMGDPDVDGESVIAKIRGPAFFPDTVSRNKVEYSRELWEIAINRPDFRKELEARRIYGTFGHNLPIDDEALRNGLISHIVKDVWIDPVTGVGMAEYLVLNTDPGRTLKVLYGAKSRLRVSTRASGKFLQRRNPKGNQVPNPKIFFLRGIDFVHDPGYLEAEPSLAA